MNYFGSDLAYVSPLDELKNSWGKRSEICLNKKDLA